MRLDLATVGGIVAGLFVVGLAIAMSGAVAVFFNMPSFLIVIGGAVAATVLRFPIDDVAAALGAGARTAFFDHRRTPSELLEDIRQLADISRRRGPIGLERARVSDPFLARGKQMIADGLTTEHLRAQLTRERELEIQRLVDGEKIFRAMGEAAPAFDRPHEIGETGHGYRIFGPGQLESFDQIRDRRPLLGARQRDEDLHGLDRAPSPTGRRGRWRIRKAPEIRPGRLDVEGCRRDSSSRSANGTVSTPKLNIASGTPTSSDR